jgi:hypothetical protein
MMTRIRFHDESPADVNADYTIRAEPSDTLAALKALTA